MNRIGEDNASLWGEEDGFFYDVLRLNDGSAARPNVRSLVGLVALAATSVVGAWTDRRFRELVEGARDFVRRHPAVEALVSSANTVGSGAEGRHLFALDWLRRILARMLDEEEFLGPHGIRSLSRYHAAHPYTFEVRGETYDVGYQPAESDSGMFGGNSNWRGPVRFPVNILLILHLPARRGGPPPGARRPAEVRQGPALEGPDPVLRVLPRRQRRRPRRRGLGRPEGGASVMTVI